MDSSVKKATVILNWPGSKLDLTLTSPSGVVLQPGIYPVTEYYKGSSSIWCVIDMPEPGMWTARIDTIDVPEEGEPYAFMTFYSSPIIIDLTTAESKYSYHSGETATVVARLTKEDEPMTGASLKAEMILPNGLTNEFVLYDDGSHGDALPNDGSYTNSYFFSMTGDYNLTVIATGTANETFERMEFMSLWVTDKGQPGTVSTLKKVTVYPNPFRPDKGHTEINFGHPTDIDKKLSAQATIKIYNIAGELIRTIREPEDDGISDGQAKWDAKNEAGEKVASGIYMYVISNPAGEKITGKVGIIR